MQLREDFLRDNTKRRSRYKPARRIPRSRLPSLSSIPCYHTQPNLVLELQENAGLYLTARVPSSYDKPLREYARGYPTPLGLARRNFSPASPRLTAWSFELYPVTALSLGAVALEHFFQPRTSLRILDTTVGREASLFIAMPLIAPTSKGAQTSTVQIALAVTRLAYSSSPAPSPMHPGGPSGDVV